VSAIEHKEAIKRWRHQNPSLSSRSPSMQPTN